jgi:hypothetical protein
MSRDGMLTDDGQLARPRLTRPIVWPSRDRVWEGSPPSLVADLPLWRAAQNIECDSLNSLGRSIQWSNDGDGDFHDVLQRGRLFNHEVREQIKPL